MALRMQQTVHQEMREMVAKALPWVRASLAHDRHADHDVCAHRFFHVIEGEHIRGVVFAAELAIQPATFARVDKTQHDHGAAFQRERRPATQCRAGGQRRKCHRCPESKVETGARGRDARVSQRLSRVRAALAPAPPAPAIVVLRPLIRLDNARHQRMTHDVGGREIRE